MSGSDDGQEEPTQPAWARFNESGETTVKQTLFGYGLALQQDPDSHHLGMTVWDASIVLAKYLEKGALRKGPASRAALAGATVLELGSGAGLAGMAAAMLGTHVTLTDVADVLPLLRGNVAANFQTAAWAEQVALREQFGSICVRELDWTRPAQLGGFGVVDCIVATDCVYHETLALDLLRVVLRCAGAKTQVLVCNELRSKSVQGAFERLFSGHFSMRRVPRKDMDAEFSSEHIHLLSLRRRRAPTPDAVWPPAEAAHTEVPG